MQIPEIKAREEDDAHFKRLLESATTWWHGMHTATANAMVTHCRRELRGVLRELDLMVDMHAHKYGPTDA